ncbi:hypothetical protein ACFOEK_19695 [Litoribrevibacter euphylliae]|uniref:Uncharacterized protein n=1 Tax=Litoribrevibacter euphylliae TaxID=1834034 RepID=A0ABV7HHE2_9GAMM
MIRQRSLKDRPNLSNRAKHRLLYTKRQPKSRFEGWILRAVDRPMYYRLTILPYMPALCALISWGSMEKAGLYAAFVMLTLVIGICIWRSGSLPDRLKYVREDPPQDVSWVFWRYVHEGLMCSVGVVVLTLLMLWLHFS